jgi:hypothetical protein
MLTTKREMALEWNSYGEKDISLSLIKFLRRKFLFESNKW